ncbi:hypothetical protein [Psychroflexus salis]|nr:hypothetical protein [Psychroflexus salis]
MKILKNNTIPLILIMSLIMSISCTKDPSFQNENNDVEPKSLLYSYGDADMGEIHNSGLEYYYENRTQEIIPNNLNIFAEELLNINKVLYPEYFEDAELSLVIKVTEELFDKKDKNEFDYKETMLELNNKFRNQGDISVKLSILLEKFIKNNPSVNDAITEIEILRAENNLTLKDEENMDMFISILIASDKFWNNKKNDSINSKFWGCNPRHQVRFADAAGGIFGGMLGFTVAPGLGAIIGGAVGSQLMSGVVEEMQIQNGGDCI